MREIGVRQLKANLSEVLRAIESGETIRVTNHGRPVADISPPTPVSMEDRLDQLVAQGLMTRAKERGPFPNAPPRAKVPEGEMTASEMIIAEREYYRNR